jgi:RNA polymerase sigma-70 factor, ECF subfamily
MDAAHSGTIPAASMAGCSCPDGVQRPTLAEAMRRVARGDEAAFAEVYDLLVPSVHRLVRMLVDGPTEVDDVVRAAFVELWRGAPDPDLTEGRPVETWLLMTAHRLARPRPMAAGG